MVRGALPADGRVTLQVVSWNHLLDLDPAPATPVAEDPEAAPQTGEHHRERAFSRRSSPEPLNTETLGRAILGRVGACLMMASPLVALAVLGATARLGS